MRLFIWCFLVFAVESLHAQISQPARYEVEEKNPANSYIIVSMKENGLALVQDKDKTKDRKSLWQLILLDTALQETYNSELTLEPRLKLVGYDFINQDLFLLFREGDTNFNNFIILKINSITHVQSSYIVKQELDFKLSHYSMLDNVAVIGGYVGNEPAVLVYDLPKENLKILPGFFLTDTEMLDLRVNKNNTFNVLLAERGVRETRKLTLRTYDSEGTPLLEDIIEIPQGKTIISGITSVLDREELLVVGAWGSDRSKQASGIFSLLIDPFNAQSIQFFGFGEMNHSFDFMRPRRAEKLKSKDVSNLKNEKNPSYKTPVHIVKLEENSTGFVALAELYSPYSVSNSNWNSYSPYNNSYGFGPYNNRYYNSPYSSYGNRQVSGVQILHSLVINFDHQGKLTKDFGMVLENTKLQALEQASDFTFLPTGVAQVYKKENDLLLNITEGNDVFTQDTVKIKLRSPLDKLKHESEENGGVRSWFKNNLYTWGYSSIKDEEKSSDPSRNVFYINKVRVQ